MIVFAHASPLHATDFRAVPSPLARHARLLVITLSFFFFSLASAFAQQPPAGATIVLPQRLIAAQPATLAVLGPDGRLLPGAEVEFSGGVRLTADETGRVVFRAPRQPGVFFVKLAGGAAGASATVAAAPDPPADAVQVLRLPRVIPLGEKFEVSGSGFRGEADANRVQLGDKPAAVLAASPVALVVIPPSDCTPGPAQIQIEVDGRSSGSLPVRVVALELVLDKDRLTQGENAQLRIRVRGTEERLEVEARNLAPDVLRLRDGDVQRVTTRGGPDNEASIRVEGVRPGDYSISLRLVRSVTGLPDTEACRQHLLSARAIAPEAWYPRLDRLVALLDESPQNSLRVRNELEKILGDIPPGEFGRLLEGAWRALL
jgi:hypothetical protein